MWTCDRCNDCQRDCVDEVDEAVIAVLAIMSFIWCNDDCIDTCWLLQLTKQWLQCWTRAMMCFICCNDDMLMIAVDEAMIAMLDSGNHELYLMQWWLDRHMLVIAVDEAVIAMLDSGNHELVFAACGVLMNLMVDDDKRPMLLNHGGVSKYVVFSNCFFLQFFLISDCSYIL